MAKFVGDLQNLREKIAAKINSTDSFKKSDGKESIRQLSTLAIDLNSHTDIPTWNPAEKMSAAEFEWRHGSFRSNVRMLKETKDHGYTDHSVEHTPDGKVRLSVTQLGHNAQSGSDTGDTLEDVARKFWTSPLGEMVIKKEDKYRTDHCKPSISGSETVLLAQMDMAVEAIASHLIDDHPKHATAIGRLYDIINNA